MEKNCFEIICRRFSFMFLLTLAGSFLNGCASSSKDYMDDQALADDTFAMGSNRPPTAETLYAMANILAVQGRESVYEFMLKRIIDENPRFLPAYCDLAELQMRQNRIDEAMETLSKGQGVSKEDPILINNSGMCWLVKGKVDRALTLFTQATALAPENARYRANMAVALGLLGRYDECLNLYQQVVPAWDAHYNVAVLCEGRKDLKRAAEEYRIGTELEPKGLLSPLFMRPSAQDWKHPSSR